MKALITILTVCFLVPANLACGQETLEIITESISRKKAEIARFEAERKRVQSQIDEMTSQAEESQAILDAIVDTEKKISEIQIRLPELEAGLYRKELLISTYQRNFRPQLALKKGQRFPSLATADGQTYTNVEILATHPAVRIKHSQGEAIIDVDNLPTEILDQSKLAPNSSISETESVDAIMESRPRQISSEHKSLIKQREKQRSERARELLEISEQKEAKRLEAEKSANEASAKIHNAKLQPQIDKAQAVLAKLNGELAELKEERRAGDSKFQRARIPNHGAHKDFLKKMDEKIFLLEPKIANASEKLEELNSSLR